MTAIQDALIVIKEEDLPCRKKLAHWKNHLNDAATEKYSSHLHSQSKESALNVKVIEPVYNPEQQLLKLFNIYFITHMIIV